MPSMNNSPLNLAPPTYFHNSEEIALIPNRGRLYLWPAERKQSYNALPLPQTTSEDTPTHRPWYFSFPQEHYEKAIHEGWTWEKVEEYKCKMRKELEKRFDVLPAPRGARESNCELPCLAPRDEFLNREEVREGKGLQFYLPPGCPERERAGSVASATTFGEILERFPWYVGVTRGEYEAVLRLGWTVGQVSEWKREVREKRDEKRERVRVEAHEKWERRRERQGRVKEVVKGVLRWGKKDEGDEKE